MGITQYIPPKSDGKCCIYRVPESIRKVNREAYTPQLISIGPLHHGKKKLATWERKKEIYKESFRRRIYNGDATIAEISYFIMSKEWDIRTCYSEDSKLGKEEFVKMILNDAIFIIELFVSNYDEDHKLDPLLDVPIVKWTLSLDLRLLENQLPYFVLEKICELAIANLTLMELSCRFFLDYNLFDINLRDSNLLTDLGVEVKHFADLGRNVLLKRFKKVESYKLKTASLPSAVKLQESGVKFKHADRDCLLEISFKKRIFSWWNELQIPNLHIYDETEFLLRNMMALEQCHYPEDNRVCSYVYLLASLMNTGKDVDLLVEAKIITRFMGNNASVAKMFNRLWLHHRIDMSIYGDIIEELNSHYKKLLNRTKATLTSVYFSDLWKGTGTVVATIVVVFQLIQVIVSIRRSS